MLGRILKYDRKAWIVKEKTDKLDFLKIFLKVLHFQGYLRK